MKSKAIAGPLLLVSASLSADAVDNAYKICQVFRNTGYSAECDVSGWSRSVDVRMDTSGREATKICAGVAQSVADNKVSLGGAWKLRIFSPFSGDHPLAVCGLP